MQVVINIPKYIYDTIIACDGYVSDCDNKKVGNAIKNGTPIQKGHGRLGDLDELETYFKNVRRKLKPADYKYAVEYFTRDNMLLNAEQFIHLMDAIIPADKDGD